MSSPWSHIKLNPASASTSAIDSHSTSLPDPSALKPVSPSPAPAALARSEGAPTRSGGVAGSSSAPAGNGASGAGGSPPKSATSSPWNVQLKRVTPASAASTPTTSAAPSVQLKPTASGTPSTTTTSSPWNVKLKPAGGIPEIAAPNASATPAALSSSPARIPATTSPESKLRRVSSLEEESAARKREEDATPTSSPWAVKLKSTPSMKSVTSGVSEAAPATSSTPPWAVKLKSRTSEEASSLLRRASTGGDSSTERSPSAGPQRPVSNGALVVESSASDGRASASPDERRPAEVVTGSTSSPWNVTLKSGWRQPSRTETQAAAETSNPESDAAAATRASGAPSTTPKTPPPPQEVLSSSPWGGVALQSTGKRASLVPNETSEPTSRAVEETQEAARSSSPARRPSLAAFLAGTTSGEATSSPRVSASPATTSAKGSEETTPATLPASTSATEESSSKTSSPWGLALKPTGRRASLVAEAESGTLARRATGEASPSNEVLGKSEGGATSALPWTVALKPAGRRASETSPDATRRETSETALPPQLSFTRRVSSSGASPSEDAVSSGGEAMEKLAASSSEALAAERSASSPAEKPASSSSGAPAEKAASSSSGAPAAEKSAASDETPPAPSSPWAVALKPTGRRLSETSPEASRRGLASETPLPRGTTPPTSPTRRSSLAGFLAGGGGPPAESASRRTPNETETVLASSSLKPTGRPTEDVGTPSGKSAGTEDPLAVTPARVPTPPTSPARRSSLSAFLAGQSATTPSAVSPAPEPAATASPWGSTLQPTGRRLSTEGSAAPGSDAREDASRVAAAPPPLSPTRRSVSVAAASLEQDPREVPPARSSPWGLSLKPTGQRRVSATEEEGVPTGATLPPASPSRRASSGLLASAGPGSTPSVEEVPARASEVPADEVKEPVPPSAAPARRSSLAAFLSGGGVAATSAPAPEEEAAEPDTLLASAVAPRASEPSRVPESAEVAEAAPEPAETLRAPDSPEAPTKGSAEPAEASPSSSSSPWGLALKPTGRRATLIPESASTPPTASKEDASKRPEPVSTPPSSGSSPWGLALKPTGRRSTLIPTEETTEVATPPASRSEPPKPAESVSSSGAPRRSSLAGFLASTTEKPSSVAAASNEPRATTDRPSSGALPNTLREVSTSSPERSSPWSMALKPTGRRGSLASSSQATNQEEVSPPRGSSPPPPGASSPSMAKKSSIAHLGPNAGEDAKDAASMARKNSLAGFVASPSAAAKESETSPGPSMRARDIESSDARASPKTRSSLAMFLASGATAAGASQVEEEEEEVKEFTTADVAPESTREDLASTPARSTTPIESSENLALQEDPSGADLLDETERATPSVSAFAGGLGRRASSSRAVLTFEEGEEDDNRAGRAADRSAPVRNSRGESVMSGPAGSQSEDAAPTLEEDVAPAPAWPASEDRPEQETAEEEAVAPVHPGQVAAGQDGAEEASKSLASHNDSPEHVSSDPVDESSPEQIKSEPQVAAPQAAADRNRRPSRLAAFLGAASLAPVGSEDAAATPQLEEAAGVPPSSAEASKEAVLPASDEPISPPVEAVPTQEPVEASEPSSSPVEAVPTQEAVEVSEPSNVAAEQASPASTVDSTQEQDKSEPEVAPQAAAERNRRPSRLAAFLGAASPAPLSSEDVAATPELEEAAGVQPSSNETQEAASPASDEQSSPPVEAVSPQETVEVSEPSNVAAEQASPASMVDSSPEQAASEPEVAPQAAAERNRRPSRLAAFLGAASLAPVGSEDAAASPKLEEEAAVAPLSSNEAPKEANVEAMPTQAPVEEMKPVDASPNEVAGAETVEEASEAKASNELAAPVSIDDSSVEQAASEPEVAPQASAERDRRPSRLAAFLGAPSSEEATPKREEEDAAVAQPLSGETPKEAAQPASDDDQRSPHVDETVEEVKPVDAGPDDAAEAESAKEASAPPASSLADEHVAPASIDDSSLDPHEKSEPEMEQVSAERARRPSRLAAFLQATSPAPLASQAEATPASQAEPVASEDGPREQSQGDALPASALLGAGATSESPEGVPLSDPIAPEPSSSTMDSIAKPSDESPAEIAARAEEIPSEPSSTETRSDAGAALGSTANELEPASDPVETLRDDDATLDAPSETPGTEEAAHSASTPEPAARAADPGPTEELPSLSPRKPSPLASFLSSAGSAAPGTPPALDNREVVPEPEMIGGSTSPSRRSVESGTPRADFLGVYPPLTVSRSSSNTSRHSSPRHAHYQPAAVVERDTTRADISIARRASSSLASNVSSPGRRDRLVLPSLSDIFSVADHPSGEEEEEVTLASHGVSGRDFDEDERVAHLRSVAEEEDEDPHTADLAPLASRPHVGSSVGEDPAPRAPEEAGGDDEKAEAPLPPSSSSGSEGNDADPVVHEDDTHRPPTLQDLGFKPGGPDAEDATTTDPSLLLFKPCSDCEAHVFEQENDLHYLLNRVRELEAALETREAELETLRAAGPPSSSSQVATSAGARKKGGSNAALGVSVALLALTAQLFAWLFFGR